MKREFSFYEFTGVLLPGATLLFGIIWLEPSVKAFLIDGEITIGALGIFTIAAYLAGHLIQSFGNIFELIAWSYTGKPIHWIRKAKRKPLILSEKQLRDLPAAIETLTRQPTPDLIALSRKETNDLRGRIYSTLKKRDRTERIDIFNGNYGMFRGIAGAAILVALLGAFKSGFCSEQFWIPLAVSILAILRWHRFGVYYARELYWEALNEASSSKERSE